MAENTAVFHVLTVYRTVALHTAVYRLYRYTAQHYGHHESDVSMFTFAVRNYKSYVGLSEYGRCCKQELIPS
jgi:hypothetical protein